MSETVESPALPQSPPPRNMFRERGITNLAGHRVPIADIDATLEKYGGDRKKTASALQLKRVRLTMAINQNPQLKLKWAKYTMAGPGIKIPVQAQIPHQLTTVSRDPLVPTLNPDPIGATELALAEQIAREDQKIKDGILRLGGTAEEADLSVSLRSFHGRHIESTLAMTTAGMALNFQRMMGVARNLEARIHKGDFKTDSFGNPVNETLVLKSYTAILEECRKTTELCLRGSLIKAKIEAMRKDASSAARGRPKPGFAAKGDTKIVANTVVLKP